jgi:hypothetical protein
LLQEQGVPLERLVWKKVVPDLSRLEGLYLEFIDVDQEVLQCMTKLAKLRCGLTFLIGHTSRPQGVTDASCGRAPSFICSKFWSVV